ncbi:hypothetical protein RYX36_021487, partial [Vicia faba]
IPSKTKNLDFFGYEEEKIQEQEESQFVCLLGKIIIEKHIRRGSTQDARANIWCNLKNLVVNEIDSSIFKMLVDKIEYHKFIIK